MVKNIAQKQIKALYIQQKNVHFIRKDPMTKITATDICNISEIFIGVLMGIPLRYIVYY